LIGRDQAESLAAEVCGAPSEDSERGWELEEFDVGWLIIANAAIGRRGGPTYVIERESGRVMRFPSIVPPTRIVEEYNEVLCYARPRN
jgi:hypothetical protein